MINFTKEEISLCKQVAEKYRKEIKYGDWYYYAITGNCFVNAPRGCYLSEDEIERKNIIPLWTISDCLEWLNKKYSDWSMDKEWDEDGKLTGNICFWWKSSSRKSEDNYTLGKTPLEACLKAVIEVLKNEKI